MRTLFVIGFALALCLIMAVTNGDLLLSNREDADILSDSTEEIVKRDNPAQRKILNADTLSEQISKEQSLVDKLKALKEDLNETAKKCKAPKVVIKVKKTPKRIIIKKVKKVQKKAAKKCKSTTEIKKLVKRNDAILKIIKKQIKIQRRPKKVTTALDVLKKELKKKAKIVRRKNPLVVVAKRLRISSRRCKRSPAKDPLKRLDQLLKKKSKKQKKWIKEENKLEKLLKKRVHRRRPRKPVRRTPRRPRHPRRPRLPKRRFPRRPRKPVRRVPRRPRHPRRPRVPKTKRCGRKMRRAARRAARKLRKLTKRARRSASARKLIRLAKRCNVKIPKAKKTPKVVEHFPNDFEHKHRRKVVIKIIKVREDLLKKIRKVQEGQPICLQH